MADLYAAVTAIGAVAALEAVACAVGWAGNHTQDIARSWAEGRDQVAVWTDAAVTRVLLLMTAVGELWALLHLLVVDGRKGGA